MNSPRTVQNFYQSISQWIVEILQNSKSLERPIIIGINGPQGCGKSTLAKAMVELLPRYHVKAAALSIDDFYLTRQEQVELGKKYPFNPLLQQRGYPGTHDIDLGSQILKSLKNIAYLKKVVCPVYDKSCYEGLGDRAPESEWMEVVAPLDVVFLEGWMLGFRPVEKSKLSSLYFEEVNQFLNRYEEWYSFFDGFIQLVPKEISYVVNWRIEAEEKMKRQGKSGMTPVQIETYVRKFIPAYETYLPNLSQNPPTKKNVLQLTLAEDRLPN